jgi:hypothetical protein
MWHLERAKEMKLPVTLRSWYNDARQKRAALRATTDLPKLGVLSPACQHPLKDFTQN